MILIKQFAYYILMSFVWWHHGPWSIILACNECPWVLLFWLLMCLKSTVHPHFPFFFDEVYCAFVLNIWSLWHLVLLSNTIKIDHSTRGWLIQGHQKPYFGVNCTNIYFNPSVQSTICILYMNKTHLFFLTRLSERIIFVVSSDFVWENLIVFIRSVIILML